MLIFALIFVGKRIRQTLKTLYISRFFRFVLIILYSHSHVALLIEKEVQPLVIAQRVGHESINTTMNVYGHLYPNKQQHIADMLNTEAVGTTIEEEDKDATNVIQFHTKRRIAKVGGSV